MPLNILRHKQDMRRFVVTRKDVKQDRSADWVAWKTIDDGELTVFVDDIGEAQHRIDAAGCYEFYWPKVAARAHRR